MLETQSFCTTSNSRKLYHHHQNRKFCKAFTLYRKTPNDERYEQNTNNKPNKKQNKTKKKTTTNKQTKKKRKKKKKEKRRQKEKKKEEKRKKKKKRRRRKMGLFHQRLTFTINLSFLRWALRMQKSRSVDVEQCHTPVWALHPITTFSEQARWICKDD